MAWDEASHLAHSLANDKSTHRDYLYIASFAGSSCGQTACDGKLGDGADLYIYDAIVNEILTVLPR